MKKKKVTERKEFKIKRCKKENCSDVKIFDRFSDLVSQESNRINEIHKIQQPDFKKYSEYKSIEIKKPNLFQKQMMILTKHFLDNKISYNEYLCLDDYLYVHKMNKTLKSNTLYSLYKKMNIRIKER